MFTAQPLHRYLERRRVQSREPRDRPAPVPADVPDDELELFSDHGAASAGFFSHAHLERVVLAV